MDLQSWGFGGKGERKEKNEGTEMDGFGFFSRKKKQFTWTRMFCSFNLM